MSEIIASVLLLLGGLFALVAALGVARLPDVYTRMHASTKAGTLAAGLVLVGVAVTFGELSVTLRAIAGVAFLVFTAPVAAHAVGRAAWRAGTRAWRDTVVNEWPRPDRRDRS